MKGQQIRSQILSIKIEPCFLIDRNTGDKLKGIGLKRKWRRKEIKEKLRQIGQHMMDSGENWHEIRDKITPLTWTSRRLTRAKTTRKKPEGSEIMMMMMIWTLMRSTLGIVTL
uniref:Uncharacterized protein n=1 Tax=Cacopsylla melanoneura TaxID=428564 RepID=A0A8D9AZB6_9HEMI